MTRATVICGIVGAAMLSFCATLMQAAQNDLSGTWVLDREYVKGLPSNIKVYNMVVTQDGQNLVVTTEIGGKTDATERGPGNTNVITAAAATQGTRASAGILVRSGGTMGDSGKPSNGSMAMQMAIPQATYSLDGRKTTAMLLGIGTATLTAKWAKGGKSLDLSMVHQEAMSGQTFNAPTSKERWTLSEDGQVLKVQRTVSTQQTSETVNLTFRKKPAAP